MHTSCSLIAECLAFFGPLTPAQIHAKLQARDGDTYLTLSEVTRQCEAWHHSGAIMPATGYTEPTYKTPNLDAWKRATH